MRVQLHGMAPQRCPAIGIVRIPAGRAHVSVLTLLTIQFALTIPQGTESELAGKSAACAGCPNQDVCASGATKGPDPALPLVRERMTQVKRKILVLSGKGGVGKSTFAAQLGWAFASDPEVQVRMSYPRVLIGSPKNTRPVSLMSTSVDLQFPPSLGLHPSRSTLLLSAGPQSTCRTTSVPCP